MPRVCIERIPDSLLVAKAGSNERRVPMTLKKEVKQWMRDNIKGHWFITFEKRDKDRMVNEYCISFSQEYDAIAWKLTWL